MRHERDALAGTPRQSCVIEGDEQQFENLPKKFTNLHHAVLTFASC